MLAANILKLNILMSRIVRKPDFCLRESKGADQLRGNREADQRLCFRYTDSIFPLLLISEISSFYSASVTVQVSLCQTWAETPKTGFLASRLKILMFNKEIYGVLSPQRIAPTYADVWDVFSIRWCTLYTFGISFA